MKGFHKRRIICMLDFKSFSRISTKYICMMLCSLDCDWLVLADPDSWLVGAGDMISDDVRMFPINLVSVNPSVSRDWAPLQPQILQVTKLEWSKTGGILVTNITQFNRKKPSIDGFYCYFCKLKSIKIVTWNWHDYDWWHTDYTMINFKCYSFLFVLNYQFYLLILSILQYLVGYKNCTWIKLSSHILVIMLLLLWIASISWYVGANKITSIKQRYCFYIFFF